MVMKSRKFAAALLGLFALGTVAAAAATKEPAYQSSVKVEAPKGRHGEQDEAARYADLAKIDAAQAISAAQARVAGKVLRAALENENGNLVYSVAVKPAGARDAAVQEVQVDAGTGTVLHVAAAGADGHDDESEDD
jgi:uncharacterized membrane protein YkoI